MNWLQYRWWWYGVFWHDGAKKFFSYVIKNFAPPQEICELSPLREGEREGREKKKEREREKKREREREREKERKRERERNRRESSSRYHHVWHSSLDICLVLSQSLSNLTDSILTWLAYGVLLRWRVVVGRLCRTSASKTSAVCTLVFVSQVDTRWTWLNVVERGWTWLNVVERGWTWLNVVERGWTCLDVVERG